MSGFNVAELMPFYLDETDEHIAGLNDALLRLEQDPSDAKALQEAFRFFHSIKGSSIVMGFVPVNQLTHQLESLFDQLRSKKRTLDRSTLDLTFGCLDELRDYHRDLRAKGQSDVELSDLIARVVAHLAGTTARPRSPPRRPRPCAETQPWLEESAGLGLIVTFEPNLPLVDMKARLVLNRVSSKARIHSTVPPVDGLENIESLTTLTIYLSTDVDIDELRKLADVEGVTAVRVEPIARSGIAEQHPRRPIRQRKRRSRSRPLSKARPLRQRAEPMYRYLTRLKARSPCRLQSRQ